MLKLVPSEYVLTAHQVTAPVRGVRQLLSVDHVVIADAQRQPVQVPPGRRGTQLGHADFMESLQPVSGSRASPTTSNAPVGRGLHLRSRRLTRSQLTRYRT